MKELGIEAKLAKLMEWARVTHDRLDTHEWVQDFRPWNDLKDQKKTHKCAEYCDHHVYYIECACGKSRKATKAEYDAAETAYSGY